MYYVYILQCRDGSLYTGITTDPARRFREHSGSAKGAKYTKAHGADRFAAVWSVPDKSTALKLEYRIKQMRRERKLSLIGDDALLPDEFAENTHRYDERLHTG